MSRWMLALVLLAPVAHAQEAKKKKMVIRLEAITVEGKIQKPQAFLVFPRDNLNKELETMGQSESFLPKVVQSVEKPPF